MKFRFESVAALGERAWATFRRFPLVLIVAAAAAVISSLLVDGIADDTLEDRLATSLLALSLGIPLFIGLRMTGESRGWAPGRQAMAGALGLLGLVLYYLSLPLEPKEADLVRFALLDGSLLLWVAFAPFVGLSPRENGFWQYNRILFLRFASAVLYSVVLFAGLALALAACDALLGIDIDEETYVHLWLWIVWVYANWFFLAGVPRDVHRLESVTEYPAGLRIFTQYVLIPLVAVYLVILYAYLGKIIVQWDLPKGWVGYPVIGVSVTGILTLLLMHPIRDRAEHAWVKAYGRFYYGALFPLIGLITVAIATRIGDYGITEKRYLVVVLTAWLFAIATFYTVKREGSIRVIPISLCLLLLLSAFGPWSATAVSKRSQLDRLRDHLTRHEILAGGLIQPAEGPIDDEAQREISNITTYMAKTHGLEPMRDWYAEPEELPDELTAADAVERMGLSYSPGRITSDDGSFSVYVPLANPLPLDGYELLYNLSRLGNSEGDRVEATLEGGWHISISELRLTTWHEDDDRAGALVLDLRPTVRELRDHYSDYQGRVPSETATVEGANERYRAAIHIDNISGSGRGDDLDVTYISGWVLLGRSE